MKTEKLPVKLTEAEITAKGRALAQAAMARVEKEAEAKRSAAGFKVDIKDIENGIHDLVDQIRTGREYRQVEIQETKDYERAKVVTFRVDTMEELYFRNMTAEERQTSFMDRPGDA